MKLGIISDTHDQVQNILRAVEFLNQNQVELIYHCGDWVSPFAFEFFFQQAKPKAPVKGVLGNNEGDRYRLVQRIQQHHLPVELEAYVLAEEVDGLALAVYHGQNSALTKALINSQDYDLVLTGHTHQPLVETIKKTLHLNPGTVCDAAASKLTTPTLALFDTQTKKVDIINFLEK